MRAATPDRPDRIEGGILGLLVGDALGVPYEFLPLDEIPALERIEMEPPPGFLRTHPGTPPGTWSDDGAHALALLASLLDRNALDLADLAARLLAWYDHGDYAVDHRVFDVGNQTYLALAALRRGVPGDEAGPDSEMDNGNGSLMRVLPLALWHSGSDAQLVADAHAQSLVTHGHPRAQVCCALYCLWARRSLEGAAKPWATAASTLRNIYPRSSSHRGELEEHIRPDDLSPGTGSGYVVDCLRSARAVVEESSTYEETVRSAIALGNDTDTTAAVAGGIAGLRAGVSGIPDRWREALRGMDIARPLIQRLVAERRAS
jgi:ADP-ribosylglycohydrolase